MTAIDRSHSKKFLQACHNGNLAKVKQLVDEYCIRNWIVYRHNDTGDTALHVAAREGHIAVVKYLCENWIEPEYKVNVTNFDMKCPLHEAAQFSRFKVLEYLINQGADVNCLKRADWTPLMLCCTKKGNDALNCIKKLLESGANVNVRNKDGWTSFLIACRSGDPEIISLLLNHSPSSIHDKSKNGRTALHIAALHGCQDALNILLTAKPDLLEYRDSSGSTPLHESVKSLNFSITKYLLKRGANVQAVDNISQNILHIAAAVGNVDVIQFILDNKIIHVNVEAELGLTPLLIAQRNNQIKAIQLLST